MGEWKVEVAEGAEMSTGDGGTEGLGPMMALQLLHCESLWYASTVPSPMAVKRAECSGARGGGSVCV